MQTDPSIQALMAEVLSQGDRYAAMGRKAVANSFYNLLLKIADVKKEREWLPIENRPKDGQKIVYYFAPFKSVHVGTYYEDGDCVSGPSGFTTVIPEVPFWMPAPLLPEESECGCD